MLVLLLQWDFGCRAFTWEYFYTVVLQLLLKEKIWIVLQQIGDNAALTGRLTNRSAAELTLHRSSAVFFLHFLKACRQLDVMSVRALSSFGEHVMWSNVTLPVQKVQKMLCVHCEVFDKSNQHYVCLLRHWQKPGESWGKTSSDLLL